MGAALTMGALVGGGSLLGSVATGLFNKSSVSSTNAANAQLMKDQMQWQSKEADINRAFQTSERLNQNMWAENMYNKYSSPQAMIEQAQAAGINPSAYLSQGASGVMQPFNGSGGSVGSGAMPSMPSVGQQQPVHYNFGNLLDGVGSFVRDVAEAKRLGADTTRIEKLTNEEFNNWVLKNKGEEVANAAKSVELDILRSTKDVRVRRSLVDLQNAIMDGYLKGDQYDLNQLEKKFKDLNNLLADENVGIAHENKLQLAWKTKYYEQIILGDLNEQRARTAQANASSRSLSASADYQEFMNSVYKTKDVRVALTNEILQASLNLAKDGAIKESQKKHIDYACEQLKKATDNYEIQMWSNIINQSLQTVENGVDVFNRYGMVKKFLSAPKSDLESGKRYFIDSDGLLQRRP